MKTEDFQNIKLEDIKGKKLFLACPMYGGQCAGSFCRSTNSLAMACGKYDIDLKIYYLFNESLITRARNYCVDEFLRSDADVMMFIDSDIGFNAGDVLSMLKVCDTENSIITGPYPKKTIAWEKVKQAVDAGAAANPFDLSKYTADYVFNLESGNTQFKINEPIKVMEAGTGFMMIHRKVFEEYEKSYPEKKYKPDHVRTEHFDGTREIMAYFDVEIDPDTKRYLSEDYNFCYNARKIGISVWMLPWIELSHVGTYTFTGSLGAMAQIKASPTADRQSNQKNYKKVEDTKNEVTASNRKERRRQKSKKR